MSIVQKVQVICAFLFTWIRLQRFYWTIGKYLLFIVYSSE